MKKIKVVDFTTMEGNLEEVFMKVIGGENIEEH